MKKSINEITFLRPHVNIENMNKKQMKKMKRS